jgi:hypothetical protein
MLFDDVNLQCKMMKIKTSLRTFLSTTEYERMKFLEPQACCIGGWDLVEPSNEILKEYNFLKIRYMTYGVRGYDI